MTIFEYWAALLPWKGVYSIYKMIREKNLGFFFFQFSTALLGTLLTAVSFLLSNFINSKLSIETLFNLNFFIHHGITVSIIVLCSSTIPYIVDFIADHWSAIEFEHDSPRIKLMIGPYQMFFWSIYIFNIPGFENRAALISFSFFAAFLSIPLGMNAFKSIYDKKVYFLSVPICIMIFVFVYFFKSHTVENKVDDTRAPLSFESSEDFTIACSGNSKCNTNDIAYAIDYTTKNVHSKEKGFNAFQCLVDDNEIQCSLFSKPE